MQSTLDSWDKEVRLHAQVAIAERQRGCLPRDEVLRDLLAACGDSAVVYLDAPSGYGKTVVMAKLALRLTELHARPKPAARDAPSPSPPPSSPAPSPSLSPSPSLAALSSSSSLASATVEAPVVGAEAACCLFPSRLVARSASPPPPPTPTPPPAPRPNAAATDAAASTGAARESPAASLRSLFGAAPPPAPVVVVARFCGATRRSSTVLALLRGVAHELERHAPPSSPEAAAIDGGDDAALCDACDVDEAPPSLVAAQATRVARLLRRRPTLLLLDGVDRLRRDAAWHSGADALATLLLRRRDWHPATRVVLSGAGPPPRRLVARVVPLPPLTPRESEALLRHALALPAADGARDTAARRLRRLFDGDGADGDARRLWRFLRRRVRRNGQPLYAALVAQLTALRLWRDARRGDDGDGSSASDDDGDGDGDGDSDAGDAADASPLRWLRPAALWRPPPPPPPGDEEPPEASALLSAQTTASLLRLLTRGGGSVARDAAGVAAQTLAALEAAAGDAAAAAALQLGAAHAAQAQRLAAGDVAALLAQHFDVRCAFGDGAEGRAALAAAWAAAEAALTGDVAWLRRVRDAAGGGDALVAGHAPLRRALRRRYLRDAAEASDSDSDGDSDGDAASEAAARRAALRRAAARLSSGADGDEAQRRRLRDAERRRYVAPLLCPATRDEPRHAPLDVWRLCDAPRVAAAAAATLSADDVAACVAAACHVATLYAHWACRALPALARHLATLQRALRRRGLCRGLEATLLRQCRDWLRRQLPALQRDTRDTAGDAACDAVAVDTRHFLWRLTRHAGDAELLVAQWHALCRDLCRARPPGAALWRGAGVLAAPRVTALLLCPATRRVAGDSVALGAVVVVAAQATGVVAVDAARGRLCRLCRDTLVLRDTFAPLDDDADDADAGRALLAAAGDGDAALAATVARTATGPRLALWDTRRGVAVARASLVDAAQATEATKVAPLLRVAGAAAAAVVAVGDAVGGAALWRWDRRGGLRRLGDVSRATDDADDAADASPVADVALCVAADGVARVAVLRGAACRVLRLDGDDVSSLCRVSLGAVDAAAVGAAAGRLWLATVSRDGDARVATLRPLDDVAAAPRRWRLAAASTSRVAACRVVAIDAIAAAALVTRDTATGAWHATLLRDDDADGGAWRGRVSPRVAGAADGCDGVVALAAGDVDEAPRLLLQLRGPGAASRCVAASLVAGRVDDDGGSGGDGGDVSRAAHRSAPVAAWVVASRDAAARLVATPRHLYDTATHQRVSWARVLRDATHDAAAATAAVADDDDEGDGGGGVLAGLGRASLSLFGAAAAAAAETRASVASVASVAGVAGGAETSPVAPLPLRRGDRCSVGAVCVDGDGRRVFVVATHEARDTGVTQGLLLTLALPPRDTDGDLDAAPPTLVAWRPCGEQDTLHLWPRRGRRVVRAHRSSAADGRVELFDAATGGLLLRGPRHAAVVAAVAFAPRGDVGASADHAATVKVWGTVTGEALHTLPLALSSFHFLLFWAADGAADGGADGGADADGDSDGSVEAAAERRLLTPADGGVCVWTLPATAAPGASRRVVALPHAHLRQVALHGATLLYTAWRAAAALHLFDLRAEAPLRVVALPGAVAAFCVARGGRLFATLRPGDDSDDDDDDDDDDADDADAAADGAERLLQLVAY